MNGQGMTVLKGRRMHTCGDSIPADCVTSFVVSVRGAGVSCMHACSFCTGCASDGVGCFNGRRGEAWHDFYLRNGDETMKWFVVEDEMRHVDDLLLTNMWHPEHPHAHTLEVCDHKAALVVDVRMPVVFLIWKVGTCGVCACLWCTGRRNGSARIIGSEYEALERTGDVKWVSQ